MTLDISTLNHVLKSMPRLCNGQQVDSKITIYIYYTYMYRNVFVLLIFLIHPIMQIWRTFFFISFPHAEHFNFAIVGSSQITLK